MKKLNKVEIGSSEKATINEAEVQIFRKSKYTYEVLSRNGKKICSAPSLPKAYIKAEKLIELPKPVVKKGSSIKSMVLDLIHKEDEDILAAVKAEHPDSKFDQSHVSWYRSTMFRDGIIGAECAPRRSKAYKLWKENNS